MLAKKFRFSGEKSLKNAMRRSKNFNTKHLNIKIHYPPKPQISLPSETELIDSLFIDDNSKSKSATETILTASTFKCAVIVSKKISKRAVKRNVVRRRIYEIIRTSGYANNNVSAQIIIRATNQEILSASYSDLRLEIMNVLNYIHK